MKNAKKILALVLALSLALCLCACGSGELSRLLPGSMSFEEKLAQSAERMKEARSMHTDVDMDLGFRVAIAGQSQSMDATAHYTTDLQTEPMKMHMIMDISALGMTQKMIYYAEQGENGITVYLSMDDGAHWTKETISAISDIAPQDLDQQTEIFLACAENFTETGKEEINGERATVYSGVISGQFVEETIKSSGALDTLSQTLGVDVPEDMFKGLGDIPATVAIGDKSGLVVRYTMDMSAVMQGLMEKMMGLVLQSAGGSDAGLELNIDRVLIAATLSQVNSVEEIVIPEEAKAA